MREYLDTLIDLIEDDIIEHHGVKGQQWGVTRLKNAAGRFVSSISTPKTKDPAKLMAKKRKAEEKVANKKAKEDDKKAKENYKNSLKGSKSKKLTKEFNKLSPEEKKKAIQDLQELQSYISLKSNTNMSTRFKTSLEKELVDAITKSAGNITRDAASRLGKNALDSLLGKDNNSNNNNKNSNNNNNNNKNNQANMLKDYGLDSKFVDVGLEYLKKLK